MIGGRVFSLYSFGNIFCEENERNFYESECVGSKSIFFLAEPKLVLFFFPFSLWSVWKVYEFVCVFAYDDIQYIERKVNKLTQIRMRIAITNIFHFATAVVLPRYLNWNCCCAVIFFSLERRIEKIYPNRNKYLFAGARHNVCFK